MKALDTNTLRQAAAKVLDLLNDELGEEADAFTLSSVLAHTFLQHKGPSPKLMNLALNGTIEKYVSLRLVEFFPAYKKMHTALVALGAVGEENSFDAGGDVYIYALPDREVPNEHGSPVVKLMVLKTQSLRFLVIFNTEWCDEMMHVRQFWDDADAELAKPNNYVSYLEPYRDSQNLRIQDVLKLSGLAEHYADDFPDVDFPTRLSLKTILAGSLKVGKASAGRALEQGAATDAGYVWSFNSARPRFDMLGTSDYLLADHVTMRLAKVAEGLGIEMTSESPSV